MFSIQGMSATPVNPAPVDTLIQTEIDVEKVDRKKRNKVSNKTKRTIGWSMIAASLLINLIAVAFFLDDLEFGIAVIWIIGVALLIPGIILVILGRRRRK